MRRVVALMALLVPLVVACGSASAAPRVSLPPGGGAVFDYQLGGDYRPAAGVRIVDRDSTSSPARGYYNVCYVNAFQTQPDARGWWLRYHPTLVVRTASGRPLVDPGWPDEYLLDTSTAAKRAALARIVGRFVDGCAHSGFDAVEPDNLDSWTRSKGRLTQAGNVALATALASRAHRDGLAIGQKNTVEIARIGKHRVHFDFAVAEECQQYHECAAYRAVYGSRVYEVEYSAAWFHAACRDHRGRNSIALRDREVVPRGAAGYRDAHC